MPGEWPTNYYIWSTQSKCQLRPPDSSLWGRCGWGLAVSLFNKTNLNFGKTNPNWTNFSHNSRPKPDTSGFFSLS